MATPTDKLNKALAQKAHTETSLTYQERASWQEALDRHVSVPASRAVEAADVFRGFSGSWAAAYEMGMGASSDSQGQIGIAAHQRKTNRLGQPGMPEVNFRPYDWGTHRFGPKGPSLLGHPISFSIVGPTAKTLENDWQWQLTDNGGTSNGDVLTLDNDGVDDVSCRTPVGGPTTKTYVHDLVGGATTLESYYGFTDLTDFSNGGLYMVISLGGRAGVLTDPAGFGGPGDGTVGSPAGNRVGISADYPAAKYEIFRIVGMDNAAKTFTLDPAKHISDYFDVAGVTPVIRSIMLFRPAATRLVAVPGSGPKGGERTFALLPPARVLGNEYTPSYEFFTNAAGTGFYDPWAGYTYGGVAGDAEDYSHLPLTPIEDPKEIATAIQPDCFNGAAPAAVTLTPPLLSVPLESGFAPDQYTTHRRLARIYEVEFFGNAQTFDDGGGFGAFWEGDPGFDWLMGYHEIVGETANLGSVDSLTLFRVPEVDPATGVPFFYQPEALQPDYDPTGPNDGIRWKLSFHDPVESLFTDPHARIDKISHARLTNLINPDWVSQSRSLKQLTQDPSATRFAEGSPDKAIFDTSTSNLGVSGSNADPGNMMDLGFRMVLFPAIDGGGGVLVPDFNRPISQRNVKIDANSADEQWWDIDYSSGLVHLSHTPSVGGDLTPGASTSVPMLEVTGSLTFTDNGGGNDTITRAAGSWVTDGVKVGQVGKVKNANTTNNNGEFVVVGVTALILTVESSATSQKPKNFTNDAADVTAVVVLGDNPRGEVVLFASCVPYSREAGQMGSGLRITAGRSDTTVSTCGGKATANADVFGARKFWRLAGTNGAPQVITSGEHFDVNLLEDLGAVTVPPNGFIEIIQGTAPSGAPALVDTNLRSASTFGYQFFDDLHGGGGSILKNCHGGVGVQTITVDDDNPYIAVLRRDVMLPSDGNGESGTGYYHDVTYGSANRATTLRFKHAVLETQVDGSVLISGLESLAETHQELFEELFTSWVIDGFEVTDPGAGVLTIPVAAGTVLIDGVRSQMAAGSVTLPGVAGSYYIYIEPLNGDASCPALAFQTGLPLDDRNHVLVGLVENDGVNVTEVVQLQNKLQDVDLRTDILVGNPSSGQPHTTSHPHFMELADAVAYACEVTRYRDTRAPSTDLNGDRYLKIRIVGPTNEDSAKLPIKFTASGIIIEGAGVNPQGDHSVSAAGAENQMSVAWAGDNRLFDLNGQSNLTFRDIVFEYRALGQAAPAGMLRSVFWNAVDTTLSYNRILNCHLVNFQEDALANPPNIAQAFVHNTAGTLSGWEIRNCSAQTTATAVYFGGDDAGGDTTTRVTDVLIENNVFQGTWLTGGSTAAGFTTVTGLRGLNEAVEIEPEPYGAIIFATKSTSSYCTVRGNRLSLWAGFGIFDNGSEYNTYDGNTIHTTADIGIWSGCDYLLYDTGNGHTSGVGVKIVNNSLYGVHEFVAPATGGAAGRKSQQEIAVIAAAPGASYNAERRAIFVDTNQTSAVVANNHVAIDSGAAADASVYSGAANTTVLGNHLGESIISAASNGESTFANNIVVGSLLPLGDDHAILSNTVDGDFSCDKFCRVAGNRIAGDFLSVSDDCAVIGNIFTKAVPTAVTTAGARSVLSDNTYSGTGANAVWELGAGAQVLGNYMPGATLDLQGDDITLAQNTADEVTQSATVADPHVNCLIQGNRLTGGVTFDAVVSTDRMTITGNRMGGTVTFANGAAAQAHEDNVIAGNHALSVLMEGGYQCIVSGNHLDGTVTLGETAGPSTFTYGAVSNNVVAGYNTTLGLKIIDVGYGGTDDYQPSILLDGSGSGTNIINGNRCAGGLVLGTGVTHNTINGNHFGESTLINASVALQGANNVFTGNYVRPYSTNGGAQDHVVLALGAYNTLSGNYLHEGVFVLAGGGSTLTGNTVYSSTYLSGVYVTAGSTDTVVSGNSIHGGQSTLAVRVDGNNCTLNGNYVTGDTLFGDVTVSGDNCSVSGNRIIEGDTTVSGLRSSVTGNVFGEGSAGGLTVSGSGSLANGNHIYGSVVFSAPLGAFTGNFTTTDVTLSAASTDVLCSNNRVGGDLVATGLDDYAISGNWVTGEIQVDGELDAGSNAGVILGNSADRIASTKALPAQHMVVLGNKVRSALTHVFGVDPGSDSVGVAASASDIVDFNVGG